MFKVIPWIGFEVKKEAWILGSPDLPCEQRTAWSSVSTSVSQSMCVEVRGWVI